MKRLNFKYLRIIFDNGMSIEFFNSDIERIESHANSNGGFVVKVFYSTADKQVMAHVDEYIFDIESIEIIEQRWEKENE